MQTYTVVGEYGPTGDMNITLETYEATFRNQTFSIILWAESFLDAVDEVKNDCRRLGIPLSDVVKITAI